MVNDKFLKIFNSKFTIGFMIFVVLGLGMAIAGDVIFQEGDLSVTGDLSTEGNSIISSGNLVINPGTLGTVKGVEIGDGVASSDNTKLRLLGGTSGSGALTFGDSGDNDIGSILYSNGDDSFTFTTNTANALKITSAQETQTLGKFTHNPNQEDKDLDINSDTDLVLRMDAGADKIFITGSNNGSLINSANTHGKVGIGNNAYAGDGGMAFHSLRGDIPRCSASDDFYMTIK